MRKDIKTKALVLRRTKYGESDRIISLLTPEGKIDVLARGVRKEKSRLAGGIEMFCLSEVMIHQHRAEQGQGQGLATLTGARMLQFYQNILTDLGRLELASATLKGVGRLAEQVNDPGMFELLRQVLEGLHLGMNLELVESYYLLNLARMSGEEVNLYFDTQGRKLVAEGRYFWNGGEMGLERVDEEFLRSEKLPSADKRSATREERLNISRKSDVWPDTYIRPGTNLGRDEEIGADEIKLMRLMLSAPLSTVGAVRGAEGMMGRILGVARAVGRQQARRMPL